MAKSQKPYQPGKGMRNYAPDVLAEPVNAAQQEKMYIITSIALFAMASVAIINTFVDFDRFGIIACVYLTAAFVLTFRTLYGAYKTHERHRLAIESGGYIHSEITQKQYRNASKYNLALLIAYIFLAIAYIAIIAIAGPKGLSATPTTLYLPLVVFTTNNVINITGGYTDILIFCDDHYITSGFTVPYERITRVVRGERIEYNHSVTVKIALYADDAQVGHDFMYEGDYEHLAGIIDAYQRYPTEGQAVENSNKVNAS
jgi:hypothetical protein